MRRRLEAVGEPLKFGIARAGVEQFVDRFGLTLVSDLHSVDLAHRYLRRVDGPVVGRPYGFAAIAHARVTGTAIADDH